MRESASLRTLAVGALLLSACSDPSDPAAPNEPDLAAVAARQGPADDPNALAGAVPGFGGFFYDQGVPTMYLKGPADRSRAERALEPYLRKRGHSASSLKVRPGAFGWAELEEWRNLATPEVLAEAGAVFIDADEASNRVRVGVERGGQGRIQAALQRAGIPAAAVIVDETEPVRFAVGDPKPKAKPGGGASLQGLVRPIVGGVQINFPGFLCTLGFNVGGGSGSFITNSHCTNVQGGDENTQYWQPLQSTDPTVIAVEAADPGYSSSLAGCPAGRVCRRSDASRAAYNSGIQFTLGRIAKTQRPRRSDLTITGNFTITGEGSVAAGQTVNKVGRTTGWSQGQVTQTCVNTNVSGTNITQLCQNFVSATVGSGDSGSPVFSIGGGDNVTLVGILWGGSGSRLFVYSPLTNVEQELGALTTH
ncbi:MAG: hypothetical protein ACREMH_01200 [Gemmatimonadales bacterium]